MHRPHNRQGLLSLPTPHTNQAGIVFLVGAGPGDPGLITLRGLERLRTADVVVYDALVSPVLLEQAPATAQRIDAGKRAREHKLTQDQTNALLVELARQGHRVVRLKGGDPLLFGRGAEEAAYLHKHGIACELIPGVTSGIAAPAYAGIPVTHRDYASTLTFVTGHEEPGKEESAINYRALSDLITAGGTVCFYMGVGRIGAIVKTLTGAGLKADVPAAVVQWGTTPRQRSVRATVGGLAQPVQQAGIGAPAIIVIGPVAGFQDEGMEWFIRRPLFGQRIVVTRTRQQVSELKLKLEELGAQVLEAPTIELAPASPEVAREVDAALRNIRGFAWLVLTSANGVTALADRLEALGLDPRHLAGVKVAAIGDATARQLRSQLGIRADLVPTAFVAESLAGELLAKENLAGKAVLMLRADIARPDLPRLLKEAGAEVMDLAVYQTKRAAELPATVLEAFKAREVDWITFTSSSTATNLVELLGAERTLLDGVKIASIGPITTSTLAKLGLKPTVEGQPHDVGGLVAAVCGAAK